MEANWSVPTQPDESCLAGKWKVKKKEKDQSKRRCLLHCHYTCVQSTVAVVLGRLSTHASQNHFTTSPSNSLSLSLLHEERKCPTGAFFLFFFSQMNRCTDCWQEDITAGGSKWLPRMAPHFKKKMVAPPTTWHTHWDGDCCLLSC